MRAGYRLIRVKTEKSVTYNQSAVLFVHCFLLRELHAFSVRHPEGSRKIRTNLVLDDGIPGVLREFTYSVYVCVIFLVASHTGTLR